MIVLTDEDVARLDPHAAVEAMRAALCAHAEGGLIAPPRMDSGSHEDSIMLSAGSLVGKSFGFRAYTEGNIHADQIVALYNRPTWELEAIVVGHLLGERRTGAIGAVAINAMADPNASTVGLIGAGAQAYSQLWALRAVRAIARVRVFSRNAGNLEAFALRVREDLGLAVETVMDPESAVRDAEIVILSTSAKTPVIEASWVRGGAHVTTLGAKTVRAHECPIELVRRASTVLTDSQVQLANYGAEPISNVGGHAAGLLGDLLLGRRTLETHDIGHDIRLFISVGITGTESLLAKTLVAHLEVKSKCVV